MSDADIEEIEADLVLEALRRRFGYDFRDYARASLQRRLRAYADQTHRREISEIIPALLHDPSELDRLVNGLSVTVTEPFRDPEAYLAFKERVIPWLKSHPFAKIWVAGCATGEEAYSLAILLEEAGCRSRVTLYATDINTGSLARASDGVYPLEAMQRAEANYRRAGGAGKLSDWYVTSYGRAKFSEHLGKNIVFTQHNLVTDASFGEMHVVVCRNVLIYFQRPLQDRVIGLFAHALARRGYLLLGARESLRALESGRLFETVDADARLYRAL